MTECAIERNKTVIDLTTGLKITNARMSRTAITLKFKMSRLLEKRKTTTATVKAKENRLKRLKADVKTLTHFT